jgi:hypothetical protein
VVAAAVEKVLIPEAAALVAEYYAWDSTFAGVAFETLGTNRPNGIGTDDLLAITLLNVRVSASGIRRVLESDAASLSAALASVPVDLPLWEASDEILDRAGQLWSQLNLLPSIGWVTAGKLLARKRPLLIPVIDQWVVAALQAPSGTYWRALRTALQDADVRNRIESNRGATPASVSTLRLLDVIIWMQYSESTAARAARVRVGLPQVPRATSSRRRL